MELVSSTAAKRSQRIIFAAQIILVGLLVLLAYQSMMNATFVWDDSGYVVSNLSLRSFNNWIYYFTDPINTFRDYRDPLVLSGPGWRPIRNLSFALDYQLFRLNPAGWHMHNILLHAAASILLLWLLRLLFLKNDASVESRTAAHFAITAGTIWWALQPVQTEVVCWVKSRDDLLCTVFSLFAMIFFIKLPDQQTSRTRTVAVLSGILFYLLALFSKENGITIPAIALLYYCIVKPGFRTTISRRIYVYLFITLAAFSLSFLAFRDLLLHGTAQTDYISGSFSLMMATMTEAWTRYLQLIMWPWWPTRLLADYDTWPYHATKWLSPAAALGTCLFLFPTVVAAASVRRQPLLTFGWFAFLIMMLPFANIVPMMQVIAERFLYMPIFGVALVVAVIVQVALANIAITLPRIRATGFSILVLLGAADLITTSARAHVWQNETRLFSDTLQQNSQSWRPRVNYLNALVNSGETTAALSFARQNLKTYPQSSAIKTAVAIAYLRCGQEVKGEKMLLDIYRHNPKEKQPLQLLITYYRQSGNQAKAEKYEIMTKSVQIHSPAN